MSLDKHLRTLLELEKSRQVPQLPRTEGALFQLLGFSPRWVQRESLDRATRFNVEIMHRRAGKSVAKIVKLLMRALWCPHDEGRYAYIAPTYGQAEDIAWTYLTTYGSKLPGYQEHKSRLAITIPTLRGSVARIRLYGVDSPKQRLRGSYLDGVCLDEFQDTPMSVFTEQVRPMLSDTNRAGVDALGLPNQWADFIGTPKGRNQLHTVFQRAEMWGRGLAVSDVDGGKPLTSHEWGAGIYPASKTGILTEAELESALRDMGRDKYEQEYECSFDAAIPGAIFAKELAYLRKQDRIGYFPYNPALPVHTAWDLGWDDATAIWFFQIIGHSVQIIDFYIKNLTRLPEIAEMMADKPYFYGHHFLPHDVEITELGSGKSRKSILQENGIRVRTVPKIEHKPDGIATARRLLYRCYFDLERTLDGIDLLALYHRQFDEKLMCFKEEPQKGPPSDAADAFQTLALALSRTKPGSLNETGPQPTSGEL